MASMEAKGHLFLDICTRCGLTWLDQDELARFLGRPRDQGLLIALIEAQKIHTLFRRF